MWGKVLTGVVIGVGAVAAAPFTGGGSVFGAATLLGSLSGAGTVAAAVGAGVVGGAVGAALDDEDDIKDAAFKEGKAEGKAENSAEITAMRQKLEQAFELLSKSKKMDDTFVALMAVAISCACFTNTLQRDKEEIQDFIFGLSKSELSESIQATINGMFKNPPSIADAVKLAKASDVPLKTFETIISVIGEMGGDHQGFAAYTHAWNQLKKLA